MSGTDVTSSLDSAILGGAMADQARKKRHLKGTSRNLGQAKKKEIVSSGVHSRPAALSLIAKRHIKGHDQRHHSGSGDVRNV